MPISRAQIKYLQSLKQKKYRLRYNKFVVEGDKMVREALRDVPGRVRSVYARPEWDGWDLVPPSLRSFCYEVSQQELERISNQKVPNQAFAELECELTKPAENTLKTGLSLYLDRIQDPGNLGTILRTADWFGLAAVFLSPDTVDPFNPKVVQSTMGSLWRVPVSVAPHDALQQTFPGLRWIGSSLNGISIQSWNPLPGSVIVIGNESQGISTEVAQSCGEMLLIPSAKNSQAESLNAAVSAGVFCARYFY